MTDTYTYHPGGVVELQRRSSGLVEHVIAGPRKVVRERRDAIIEASTPEGYDVKLVEENDNGMNHLLVVIRRSSTCC